MRILHTFAFAALAACFLPAQTTGGDIIVGNIMEVGNFGTDGSGIFAYSLGTDACNIGTAPVPWTTASNDHAVIAQHIYRLRPVAGQPYSRFEQIGLSWLKHTFAAGAGSTCAPCQGGSAGSLGIGCSDVYGSGLNGLQTNAPRSDVNATTGYFPYPPTSFPTAPATIGRRIQCQAADVNPALNAAALYFGETQYVTPTDALAGNGLNNASYRPMSFSATSFTGSFAGPTVQQQSAIMAWQAQDPAVQITNVDFANDGRFKVATKVTSLGGGNYHYELVVYNLNSDRSGGGFTVDFPAGTTISQAGFRSIPYHSFEIWDGAPWNVAINGNSIHWATAQTYFQNQRANALRWGTSYNFWFDATAAAETNKTIDLFKPPPCPPDPIIAAPGNYAVNIAAAFDNPTLTAPVPGPSGDDVSFSVPIGFSFVFYGTSYATVNVCTNGFLQFNGSSIAFNNLCLPSLSSPHGMVAGYWDNLSAGAGQITYQTLGSAPNRRFVVFWNAVSHFGAPGQLESLKIILDEGTNLITTTILSSSGGGSGATRGVQNLAGTLATQASCNMLNSAVGGTSQTYTWTTTIIPSATLAVTGSTGPNGVLTWAINSNAIAAPVVLVASLDPGPMNLGPLGIINLGLTPGLFAVLADGAGSFGPANPTDIADGCGDFQFSLPLGPAGLPPGLTIYNQGAVFGPGSHPPPPNGQFHITTPVTITT